MEVPAEVGEMKCDHCPRTEGVRRRFVQVLNRSETRPARPWCVEAQNLCDQCALLVEGDVVTVDDGTLQDH